MVWKDIDVVMLVVFDYWYALVVVEVVCYKKDIYGEKFFVCIIAEQQAIVKAVQENQRIWQTGSWQRLFVNFCKVVEIVRNGLIGKVTHVEVGLPAGHGNPKSLFLTFMSVTELLFELDYETWIGASKMMPYIEGRVHQNWRWNYN